MKYLGVYGENSTEKTIEKSRFIAYADRVASEEEAKAFLVSLRASHPLCTHICYGYIADRAGNLMRFSDDGEPQGTAGMPILNVLKTQRLRETAVAVVRYFGGIKLGAGGLTRAYASSAAEVVLAAAKRSFEPCVELSLLVSYPEVGALLRFLEGSGASTLRTEYGERAEALVAIKEEERAEFTKDLLGALCGKVQITEGKRYFYPFPVEK